MMETQNSDLAKGLKAFTDVPADLLGELHRAGEQLLEKGIFGFRANYLGDYDFHEVDLVPLGGADDDPTVETNAVDDFAETVGDGLHPSILDIAERLLIALLGDAWWGENMTDTPKRIGMRGTLDYDARQKSLLVRNTLLLVLEESETIQGWLGEDPTTPPLEGGWLTTQGKKADPEEPELPPILRSWMGVLLKQLPEGGRFGFTMRGVNGSFGEERVMLTVGDKFISGRHDHQPWFHSWVAFCYAVAENQWGDWQKATWEDFGNDVAIRLTAQGLSIDRMPVIPQTGEPVSLRYRQ